MHQPSSGRGKCDCFQYYQIQRQGIVVVWILSPHFWLYFGLNLRIDHNCLETWLIQIISTPDWLLYDHRVTDIKKNQTVVFFLSGKSFVRWFGGAVASFGSLNTTAKRRIVNKLNSPLLSQSQGAQIKPREETPSPAGRAHGTTYSGTG